MTLQVDMTIQADLVSIERSLWTEGPDAYHRHLDDRCLVAFTEMAGVSTRAEVAETVSEGPRWRDVDIEVRGMIEPTSDCVILTYEGTAARGEERYQALVSSVYVRRDGDWKLAFHQQTPTSDV